MAHLKPIEKLDLQPWIIRSCQIARSQAGQPLALPISSALLLPSMQLYIRQNTARPPNIPRDTSKLFMVPPPATSPALHPSSVRRSVGPTLQKRSDAPVRRRTVRLRRQLSPPPPFAMAVKRDIAILFPIREWFTISELSRQHTQTDGLPVFAILISYCRCENRLRPPAAGEESIDDRFGVQVPSKSGVILGAQGNTARARLLGMHRARQFSSTTTFC